MIIQEIKQIGGRAGRYGSLYPLGEVACLRSHDVDHLNKSMSSSDTTVKKAGSLVNAVNATIQLLLLL